MTARRRTLALHPSVSYDLSGTCSVIRLRYFYARRENELSVVTSKNKGKTLHGFSHPRSPVEADGLVFYYPESPSTDQRVLYLITAIDWKLQPMGWIRLTTTTMALPSDDKRNETETHMCNFLNN